EACWALGGRAPRPRAAIPAALKPPHETDVTVPLLLAAAKLRPLPLSDVTPLLRAVSPPVVWAASYAIARTRSPAGVRELIELDASSLGKQPARHSDRESTHAAPYA